LRRIEHLGSDLIGGTPGTIADKRRILGAAAPASSGTASSATATTVSSAASREATATTGAAASKTATAATSGATPTATWSASSTGCGNTRLAATREPRAALIATGETAVLAKSTGIKSRKITLIRSQGVAHGPVHQKRFVRAVRGNLWRRELRSGVRLRWLQIRAGLYVLRRRTRRRG